MTDLEWVLREADRRERKLVAALAERTAAAITTQEQRRAERIEGTEARQQLRARYRALGHRYYMEHLQWDGRRWM